jgi:diketogulonate reductase-like aldo/keto reductase
VSSPCSSVALECARLIFPIHLHGTRLFQRRASRFAFFLLKPGYERTKTDYPCPSLSLLQTWQSGPNEVRKAVAAALKVRSSSLTPRLFLGPFPRRGAKQPTDPAGPLSLQAGYRHIDTAAAYGNEAEVGQGIVDSGVPRNEIWLTTKLNNPDHKRVKEALEDSLKNLGTDYVDLYLSAFERLPLSR